MRDLKTLLKNFFSQAHFYQYNDEQMKKKQLINKKYRTEEKVIAQSFTADCCAVAPLHFYCSVACLQHAGLLEKLFGRFQKANKQKQFYLSCLLEEIIRRQDYVN